MEDKQLDVLANRNSIKYSKLENTARVAWALGKLLFRLTPRPCYALRCLLLKVFGAKIGVHVRVHPHAQIFFPWKLAIGSYSAIGESAVIYNLGYIYIGSRTTISQRAHLCAGSHDFTDVSMPLLKPPISIGDDAWVCADAYVGPGVEIGNGAIVGARAVVVKDVPDWTIVAGNPAKHIRQRILK